LLHRVIVNDISDHALIAGLRRRMNDAVDRKSAVGRNPAQIDTPGFRRDLAADRFLHRRTGDQHPIVTHVANAPAGRCFRMLALRPASRVPTRPISSREFECMEPPQCA
jgi:hypothetical protein